MATQFLRIFLVCVVGVPFIFMLIDLVDNIDGFIDQGVSRLQVARHYLFQFPYQSLLGFPIAALLGSVFTVATLTRRSEVTAAKAGGVSFYRLCLPILISAVLLSLAGLAMTEIVAVTNRLSAEALVREEMRSDDIRLSFVYRGEDGYVYKVRRLDAREGLMTDVQVERRTSGEDDYPSVHVSAESARYDSTLSRWVLSSGWARRMRGPGAEQAYRFDELHVRQLSETPEELQARPKEPDEMRYAELGRLIEAIERSGSRGRMASELRTARNYRVAFPFACVVIVVFGMPLAYSNRRGGAPTSIGIALGTTILFLTVARIAEAIGAGGALSPVTAAWLPNLLFLGAGALLWVRLRT